MKIFFAYCSFFLLPFAGFAQQFTATVCDDCVSKGGVGSSIKFGTAYYALNLVQKGFNPEMKIDLVKMDEQSKKLLGESKNPVSLRMPLHYSLQEYDNNLYLLYQERDKNNNVLNLSASLIDTTTLSFGAPKTIGNMQSKGYATTVDMSWPVRYALLFRKSPDKQRIAVVMTNEETAAECYMLMLDNKLNVLWERKETFNRQSNLMSVKDASADNSGNIYLSYRFYESRKETLPANTLSHLAIYNSTKKVADYTLDMGNAYSNEFKLLTAADNRSVHVMGYYYTDDKELLQGVFYGKLNTEAPKRPVMKTTPFPRPLVEQLDKDGWASTKQSKYGVQAVLVPKVFELVNGTANMIGEFRSYKTGERNNSFNFAGSIVNIYFAEAGPVFSRIPKYRVSAGSTAGDSYSAFPFKDKVIVFYNEKEENLKKDITDGADNSNVYKNVVMAGAVIDANGNVNRQVVIDQQKENYLALTNLVTKRGDDLFLVPMFKVKSAGGLTDDYKLGRVRVE